VAEELDGMVPVQQQQVSACGDVSEPCAGVQVCTHHPLHADTSPCSVVVQLTS